MTKEKHRESALEHVRVAEKLLGDVHGRTDEGPGYGSVKAAAANAHALLALAHFEAGKHA